jgi:ubiquinone/menaquinone biosynthesis C-methylase UbiE
VAWTLGPRLVSACGIAAGQDVLDVGAGSGNAAIRAAQAGARVIASDLTPEMFDAGRREAAAAGVALDWVEADAQSLPFADGRFDAVVSCIGAMFAPDHRATAAELVRVCRPGGTVAMINWTPEGLVGDFFGVFAPYAPPSDGPAPVAWGSEDHVQELLGDALEPLRMERDSVVVDDFARPAELVEYYKRWFGPTIAAYESVAGDPERLAALDRDFLDFATRSARGGTYEYEYLLVVGRKR